MPPHIDRAYDLIDALIAPETGQYIMESYGYGHANRDAFTITDKAVLANLGLDKDPDAYLEAGVFGVPQLEAVKSAVAITGRDLRLLQESIADFFFRAFAATHQLNAIFERQRPAGASAQLADLRFLLRLHHRNSIERICELETCRRQPMRLRPHPTGKTMTSSLSPELRAAQRARSIRTTSPALREKRSLRELIHAREVGCGAEIDQSAP